MTARVTIAPDRDLAAVSAAAGQPDPDRRWYARGMLHVEGVAQGALEAAATRAVVARPPDPVEGRLAADPVLRALLRRQAKVEGKTLAHIVAELKAELP